MIVLIGKRLGIMVLTMFAVSLLLFLLLEFSPGSVATKVLGQFASEEQKNLWLEQRGYFEPVWYRYFAWASNFITGDLGISHRYKAPVADILWPRLWNTAILGFWTFALLIPISLALGVLAGMREGSKLDRTISVTSIITTSIPEFASAVFLSAIFVFGLKLLPGTSGMIGGFEFKQLVLPVLVLLIYDFGYVTRMTRASMAEVMTTHYVRTAVLKGLPRHKVILDHALRNALIAPFTVIMLQINWLLSGVIVVEFAFAYKGFGALLLEASLNQDIFVIEACSMVAVFVAVSTQTLADIGYTYLNPRIRFQ
ncbi:MAG: ABC transporter permease [Alphaproteobacteria bacterium]|jgi:peptide/nickel transport system permease protein|nr:ABC transporter permease [Alphaproteobacteria bacterium]MBT4084075.1 ABC transporter permease [Alphaproteobacteria bacterium]MBT4544591.1 ABC transporter permease [Alphaproteobacteria bacterium]MBT7746312.1 ABC transporter permease [Alphaproteobacteria bacterium]